MGGGGEAGGVCVFLCFSTLALKMARFFFVLFCFLFFSLPLCWRSNCGCSFGCDTN